jgi:hypothetical protein
VGAGVPELCLSFQFSLIKNPLGDWRGLLPQTNLQPI